MEKTNIELVDLDDQLLIKTIVVKLLKQTYNIEDIKDNILKSIDNAISSHINELTEEDQKIFFKETLSQNKLNL